MTIFTGISRAYVSGVLAGGVYAIVARRAVTCDAGVIELSIIPRVGVVAVIAGVGAGNVICGFAFCGGSVMARATRA